MPKNDGDAQHPKNVGLIRRANILLMAWSRRLETIHSISKCTGTGKKSSFKAFAVVIQGQFTRFCENSRGDVDFIIFRTYFTCKRIYLNSLRFVSKICHFPNLYPSGRDSTEVSLVSCVVFLWKYSTFSMTP